MGHLCSNLPNFCQASPGHIDASRLVELFCNELSTQQSQRNPDTSGVIKLTDGVNDRRRRKLQGLPSTPQTPNQRSQLNWIRVRQAGLAFVRNQENLAALKGIHLDGTPSENSNEEKKSQSDQETTDEEVTDSSTFITKSGGG